jgi:hypothetical protein
VERDHHRLHLRVQLGDHLVQVGDVVQVELAHQGVMVIEPAFQRLGQVADLGAHPAARQVRQHLATAFPVDQRPDHRQARDCVNAGGHRVQLDPRVLQHPAQPLGLRRPLLDDLRR